MDDGRSITVVEDFPYPPAKVWRAFADSTGLAKWMMPNDFQPVVGHEFRMTGVPVPAVDFSGIVLAKVLELEENRRLKISWTDDRRSVDWTVTWSLEPHNGGTRLTLIHDGFDPDDPHQQVSRKIMGSGWVPMTHKIGKVIAELEAA